MLLTIVMIIHVRNVIHLRNDCSCAKRQQCKSWHKTLAGGESGLKAKGHNYNDDDDDDGKGGGGGGGDDDDDDDDDHDGCDKD